MPGLPAGGPGPERAIPHSIQHLGYSLRIRMSASGHPLAFMFTASHSNLFCSLMATFPSSTNSVSRPA